METTDNNYLFQLDFSAITDFSFWIKQKSGSFCFFKTLNEAQNEIFLLFIECLQKVRKNR